MLFFANNTYGKAIHGKKQTNTLPAFPPQNNKQTNKKTTKAKPTNNCFLILVNWESKN